MRIIHFVQWSYTLIFSLNVSRGFSNYLSSDSSTAVEKQVLSDELLNTVITEYFQNDDCVILVADSVDPINPVYSISSSSYVLISSKEVCKDPTLVDQLIFAIDRRCYSYIITATNPKCVLQAWREAQLSQEVPTIQRVSPKIFVFISDDGALRTPETVADEFLSLPEAELSSNIVVATVHLNESDWPINLYTNNFYERVGAQGREPKIFLDRWSRQKGFERGTDLYEDKILNMKGKVLNVFAVDTLPYAELERFVGLEVQIIKTFCELHNCIPTGVTDGFFYGEIFDNGTGNGMLGMVHDGRAEFGVSGAYMWASYFRHIDISHPYLHSGVTLLVPKPEVVGGWLVPFLPFSPEMWIAYFLSVGATGICMFIITKATIKYTRFAEAVKESGMFLTPMDTVFRSLGLSVLQQPSTPLVPHTPIRHLFTSFEVLYLILSTIYAAELASYLTAPQYSKPIDTLQELASSQMIWIAEHIGWVFSLLGSDSSVIETIIDNFRVETLEKINELAITGKYGLIMERLAGGHFCKREYLTEQVITQSHIMAEFLYDSPPITIIRKASPYAHHFNKVIGRLLDYGLLLNWEAVASRLYLSSRMETALEGARKFKVEDESRPLTSSDFLGMFLLYLVGILISTAVFVGEIITAKKAKKATLTKSEESAPYKLVKK